MEKFKVTQTSSTENPLIIKNNLLEGEIRERMKIQVTKGVHNQI